MCDSGARLSRSAAAKRSTPSPTYPTSPSAPQSCVLARRRVATRHAGSQSSARSEASARVSYAPPAPSVIGLSERSRCLRRARAAGAEARASRRLAAAVAPRRFDATESDSSEAPGWADDAARARAIAVTPCVESLLPCRSSARSRVRLSRRRARSAASSSAMPCAERSRASPRASSLTGTSHVCTRRKATGEPGRSATNASAAASSRERPLPLTSRCVSAHSAAPKAATSWRRPRSFRRPPWNLLTPVSWLLAMRSFAEPVGWAREEAAEPLERRVVHLLVPALLVDVEDRTANEP